MDTKVKKLGEGQIMVVVTATTDFTQFHIQLSSDEPMSAEDIGECLESFCQNLAEHGISFMEDADHVGEIN